MKRRSQRSRSRKKAEEGANRVEFSDDDNHFVVSSGSDYHTSEDDDNIDISEENVMGGLPFNYLVIDEVGFSDDDVLYKVPKRRRKVGSTRRGIEMDNGFKEEKLQNEEVVDGSKFGVGGPHTTSPEFIALINRINERKKKRIKKRKDRPILMWEVWDDDNDQWLVENFTTDVETDNRNEVMFETAEAPSELIMPLLRYQKEWLAWALKQEESASKGGILADEMGMGKTVQAIALVLAKRELKRAIGEHCLPSSSPSTSQGVPAIKGTLVICPVVAVRQWVSEIDRFTVKGSNKVLVYHGKNREKYLDRLSEYDFVITTYSTVEFDYRKYVMPPKQRCEMCGRAFYEKRMAVHQRYFCGPDATKTAKQSKQQKKKPKYGVKLSMEKTESNKGKAQQNNDSEGNPRKKGRKKGVKSYTIDNECSNNGPFENIANAEQVISGKSILHSVKWDRIILDEAHYIKERRSNTTKAILALESSYKWALSGTPLQNRVGELYSLVRFLQIIPYSYYFCKDCDCRALDYCSSTECPHCPHKSVRHFCWWNRYIASPIQAEGHYGNAKDAMILLTNKILKSILLRRTKKGRAADLALPPRIVTLRRDSLDVKEEDYYTSLYNESQAQFNTYVREGTVSNNYAHIFELLTRLRQAVDHPYLVEYSASALARSENAVDASILEQPCGICLDSVEEPVVTSCAHTFCRSCLMEFSSSMPKVSCPTCSKPLTVDLLLNSSGNRDSKNRTTIKGFRASSILNRILLDEFQTSTKIDALREEIRFMVERDGSAKGIVFSQFTEFLDLIHYSLMKSGVNCVMLMGSMSMAARESAITKFTEDPECRIFLMSLKAGGVALNLTVASHVFLMDPWWNPAVERQAQDRIHRIGQYKPIRIVRFVIDNTIEERILKLQEKKELVFEGTIGGSSDALGKLTEGDLKFLFVT